MSKLKQNSLIGIATRRDLTDMRYGRAWKDFWFEPKKRIDSFIHSDGTERFVFQVHNLFLVVAEPVLAA